MNPGDENGRSMVTRLPVRPNKCLEPQLNPAQQSCAHAIRWMIVHGFTLCAISSTEMRTGSIFRADQVLVKAKKVTAQISRDLI